MKKGLFENMFCVRYCDVCGKDFVVQEPKLYAWRRVKNNRLKYFCSYTCYNKSEDKKVKK